MRYSSLRVRTVAQREQQLRKYRVRDRAMEKLWKQMIREQPGLQDCVLIAQACPRPSLVPRLYIMRVRKREPGTYACANPNHVAARNDDPL